MQQRQKNTSIQKAKQFTHILLHTVQTQLTLCLHVIHVYVLDAQFLLS